MPKLTEALSGPLRLMQVQFVSSFLVLSMESKNSFYTQSTRTLACTAVISR